MHWQNRMKNHIIGCRYEKSTGKFDNHVFECSDKNAFCQGT